MSFTRNKNGHYITRNVSHFKPVQIDSTCETDDDNTYTNVGTNNNNNNDNNNRRNNDNCTDEPFVRRSTRSTRVPERYGHPIS